MGQTLARARGRPATSAWANPPPRIAMCHGGKIDPGVLLRTGEWLLLVADDSPENPVATMRSVLNRRAPISPGFGSFEWHSSLPLKMRCAAPPPASQCGKMRCLIADRQWLLLVADEQNRDHSVLNADQPPSVR